MLTVLLAGCDLNQSDDAPDPSEWFENVSFPLVAGLVVTLQGTIHGDTPADSIIAALRTESDARCIGLRSDDPGCVPVGQEVVRPPSRQRLQRIDTAVTIPADLVSEPTELEFMILAFGGPRGKGRSQVVTVLPALEP